MYVLQVLHVLLWVCCIGCIGYFCCGYAAGVDMLHGNIMSFDRGKQKELLFLVVLYLSYDVGTSCDVTDCVGR